MTSESSAPFNLPQNRPEGVSRSVLSGLRITTAVTLLGLLWACAGGGDPATEPRAAIADVPIGSPPRTGFLGDYSSLRKSNMHTNTWLERSASISNYHGFIVDEVTLATNTATDGTPLDAATAASLASAFRAELVEAISRIYCASDANGPNVARVRAVITEVRPSHTAEAAALATMGGAAMELEVVDYVTGERLVAVIDSGTVSSYDSPSAPNDRFEHARITFRHWASRLIFRLGAYGEGETVH